MGYPLLGYGHITCGSFTYRKLYFKYPSIFPLRNGKIISVKLNAFNINYNSKVIKARLKQLLN